MPSLALANSVTRTETFDALLRATHVEYKKTTNSLKKFEYIFNLADQRLLEKRHHSGGTGDNYKLDSIYRSIEVKAGVADPIAEHQNPGTQAVTSTTSVTYDKAQSRTQVVFSTGGTPTTTNYTPDALNFYTSVGGTTHVRDANGSLTDDGTHLYEYDYRNQLVRVKLKADSSVVATYEYDGRGRRISKSTSATTITCAPSAGPPIGLKDVYVYHWRCSRGSFIGREGLNLREGRGSTVAWTVDSPADRTPVTFWVDVYSRIDQRRTRVGSHGKRIAPGHLSWKRQQAAYIAFIDTERADVDAPRASDLLPCTGDQEVVVPYGKRMCVKKGPVAEYSMLSIGWAAPGAQRVHTGYTFQDRRWRQWGIPREQFIGTLDYPISWSGRGLHHPWATALKALIGSANDRPPPTWHSASRLRVVMNSSREFRHMAGIDASLLVRRNRIVAVVVKDLFCELGWTPMRMWKGVLERIQPLGIAAGAWSEFGVPFDTAGYSASARNPALGDFPKVALRLSPSEMTFRTGDEFRIGYVGNALNRILTNRNAPWLDVNFEMRVSWDDLRPIVSVTRKVQYPTVFAYAGTDGLRKDDQASKAQTMSIVAIHAGTKCFDKTRSGL